MQNTRSTLCGVALSLLGVLVPLGAVAADLTPADFETCNRTAMLAAGIAGSSSQSGQGASGTGETKTPPAASPSTTAPSTSPSTAPGSPAEGAGTGGKAADAQLEAIVEAYRECLKRKM